MSSHASFLRSLANREGHRDPGTASLLRASADFLDASEAAADAAVIRTRELQEENAKLKEENRYLNDKISSYKTSLDVLKAEHLTACGVCEELQELGFSIDLPDDLPQGTHLHLHIHL